MVITAAELDAELAALGARGHRALIAGLIRGSESRCRGWSPDGVAPDASTMYGIGSITKVFTGVLLADMVLRGQVSLADPLSRHLPSPRPAWRHREPTLLELATHRSDLPNTPRPMSRRELAYALGIRRGDPWTAVSATDYRRMVTEESPRRAPGRRARYSSMGVGLLGDALAARAERSYEELLAERILGPLGMSSTGVRVPAERSDRLLAGHSRRGRPRPDRGSLTGSGQPALEHRRHGPVSRRVPSATRESGRCRAHVGPTAAGTNRQENAVRVVLDHRDRPATS